MNCAIEKRQDFRSKMWFYVLVDLTRDVELFRSYSFHFINEKYQHLAD